MPIDITADNFEPEVMASPVPVLGYFHLPNCARCATFKSLGEALEKNNSGKLKLARFDITRNQKLAGRLGVLSAPTFTVFRDGEKIEQFADERLDRVAIEAFVRQMVAAAEKPVP